MNSKLPMTDVLIIGAGLAGMSAALSLPPQLRVTLLSKSSFEECASAWAQGGIAAVLDAGDSVAEHVQDTLIAGAGLCDEAAVRQILEQAPAAMAWLQSHDVPFSCNADGSLHLTREGGHGQRRIAHAADRTGHAVHTALLQACQSRSNLTLLENTAALALLQDVGGPCSGACTGAWLRLADGSEQQLQARHTILATGGMGQIYPYTTNPGTATGDGLAMAWRAGCRLQDLEFMQFHPTALQIDGKAAGLVSEALRGEGALLKLPNGERFMLRHDERAELAPRDIVARAIWAEMAEHGLAYVHLDISHQSRSWLEQHFPGVMALCAAHGIDIASQPIPVAPCAHYACGGIQAGVDGRTEVPQLYAIGEVARTGLHGANRLASNSLLECVVMGRAAAQHIAGQPLDSSYELHSNYRNPDNGFSGKSSSNIEQELRQLMLTHVGIVRSNQGLARAAEQLALWRAQLQDINAALRNQLDVCTLMVHAALQRQQSVGAHCNSDYPTREMLAA